MGFPVQNLIVQKRTAKHKAGPLDAPVALYNPDGTPFKAGSDAPTTIPQGALVPGAGIDLVRDQDSGVITASVKAKGITAGMLADGVAVSGPKGDKGDPGTPGAKGATGAPGPAGKSVTKLALTTDAAGKVTGGTVTFSDDTTAQVTVTTATAPAGDQPADQPSAIG
ncbi:hypothetical protein BW12_07050 [Bifidobacterium sp. UTCIF-3]|uniref:hypothetical protein n=1 Tax=unclassified Bifidobacterium TaxID=2608897 RepID=UPI001127FA7A|nr:MULTISPECIES: hypothetical protein [unclassified Bifidobacterium]TPF78356.1 hypothetical protein BW09_04695 [Bifidobacterium sp. UTCIF-1]TPF81223.1 hypothetical protein BW08_00885 [Bifidobacterium sp. UTCIF-24]TPF82004.1 hypothetical protein BW12_07050 [Bifidobacterium sp. UTCIF-3]TPF85148.1 hypothetical protein BW07_00300 [Bifidobacterium sp. UTCIF-36]